METKESIGSSLWKLFGQSFADKVVALAMLAFSLLTGVTSRNIDPGTIKTLLLFSSVGFLVAFFVVLYVNHKYTELHNNASRAIQTLSQSVELLQQGDREWRAGYSNLRTDFTTTLNQSRAEFLKYLEVVGLMRRYAVGSELADRFNYMGGVDEIVQTLAAERRTLEQSFSEANTSIPPAEIKRMFDPFYSQF